MWDYYNSPSEAFRIVAELHKYASRFFDLSEAEQAEIQKLTNRLEMIQKSCGHTWQEYTLMNGIYRECRYCAKSERVR